MVSVKILSPIFMVLNFLCLLKVDTENTENVICFLYCGKQSLFLKVSIHFPGTLLGYKTCSLQVNAI